MRFSRHTPPACVAGRLRAYLSMRRAAASASAAAAILLAGCAEDRDDGPAPAGGGGSPGGPAGGVGQAVPADPAAQPGGGGGGEAFMQDVDAARAAELLAADDPPAVIDVRTPEEFAQGHLPGAVNIDFQAPGFRDALAQLDRDARYLLHCRSGGRSGQSKKTFLELGFGSVYHLDGGLLAWEAAGHDVVTPAPPPAAGEQ